MLVFKEDRNNVSSTSLSQITLEGDSLCNNVWISVEAVSCRVSGRIWRGYSVTTLMILQSSSTGFELQKPLNYTAMKMAMGVRVKREKRPSGDTNKDFKQ